MTGQVVVIAALVLLLWGLLFWRTGPALGWSRRGRWWAAGGSFLLVALASVGMVGSTGLADPRRWRWLMTGLLVLDAFFLYLLIGLLAAGLAGSGWRLVDRLRGVRTDRAVRFRRLRRLTAATTVAAALVTGYGVVEAARPETTRFTVTSADLPAEFDGFRIALITDLHVGPARDRDFVERLVAQVNAEQVDLVVIAGDLVDGPAAALADDLAPLAQMRTTYPVVVTTGNHEVYSNAPEWVATWRRQGLTVLTNEALVLSRGSASIDVLGVNDRSSQPPLTEDLQAAVTQLPQQGVSPGDTGRFRLLIAHQPRMAASANGLAARSGVDLQLSGHTHGGQMWPLHYLVPLQQPYLSGYQVVSQVPVYTSRGAGSFGPPVRVGAPPEIPVITLQRP